MNTRFAPPPSRTLRDATQAQITQIGAAREFLRDLPDEVFADLIVGEAAGRGLDHEALGNRIARLALPARARAMLGLEAAVG